jgi:ABC-type amino acid transport substrate-binding protein
MMPERWLQEKDIFAAALGLRPEARQAYLAEACAGDPALRAGVEALLANWAKADTEAFLAEEGLRPPPWVIDGIPPRLPDFDDYQDIEYVGHGGMGVVYRAFDRRLKVKVALKVPVPDLPPHAARFLQDPEHIARLHHQNIVQVHKAGEHNGRPYFTMNLIEGPGLEEHLGGHPRDPRAVAGVMVKVARAVHHAHQRCILHRDLKPGNILLDRDGEPLVIDFGLATESVLPDVADGGAVPTRDTASRSFQGIQGTIGFMSPEQAEPPKEVTTLSDVYGLGAVLYALLTGRPPFRDDDLRKLLRQVRDPQCQPEPPGKLNPRVDRDLQAICLRCLNKDPAGRYRSAEGVAKDLERWLDGRETEARPWGRVERVAGWCRRNLGLAGLSALAATLLVALIVLLTMMVPPWDGSLQRVKLAGKLVIATDPDYPPMEFHQDGKFAGFDIDLGRELARRLGVQAVFRGVEWDWQDLTRQLDAHDFDLLLSTVVVTDDRKRQVDFVEYLEMDHVFVGKRGQKVQSAHDLAGKVVAVQKGTYQNELVARFQKNGIQVRDIIELPSGSDPFDALLRGKADVAFADEVVARHYAGRHQELAVAPHVLPELNPDVIGIAFCNKDNKLRAAVSDAIKAMKADGTFARLKEQWIPSAGNGQ